MLTEIQYLPISSSYQDSWHFYDKGGQTPPALSDHVLPQLIMCCQLFPHQWNLQNRGGTKQGKYDIQYMSLQNFRKITNISKLPNSITHHTAIHMLTSTTRVRELGLCIVQERKDKFPFCSTHITVKVYFCKFNSDLFNFEKPLQTQIQKYFLFPGNFNIKKQA